MAKANQKFILMLFSLICIPALTLFASDGKQDMEKDVFALVAAAQKIDKAWPWQGAIPEVNRVARYGKRIAPLLVEQLRFEEGMQFADQGWDVHVEQQIELALCKIYNIRPESGETIYGIRSSDDDNGTIRQYWQEIVSSNTTTK